MKKNLFFICLAIVCSVIFSSCREEAPEPCSHDWIKQSTSATCTADGEAVYRCTECGEEKTQADAAYGCFDDDKDDFCDDCGTRVADCAHKITVEVGYTPTCTQEGLTDGKYCSKCGTVFEEKKTIPALGHETVKQEAIPATCISTGLTEGASCSRCETVLLEQTVLPELPHVGDEGVCTYCNTITNAALALGTHIKKNGTKLDSGNRYTISKELEEQGYTALLIIEYDADLDTFIFTVESTTDGIDSYLMMKVNRESNIQKAEMKMRAKVNNILVTCNGSAEIDALTFNAKRPEVISFECSNERFYDFVETYCGETIAKMLTLCAELIHETETGVTMPMLGFPNF